MNKYFSNINGLVVVSGEKGFIKTMPYSDYVEDILVTENELALLKKYYSTDSKAAESKQNERDYRMRFFKQSIPVANIAGAAASLFSSFVFTIGVDSTLLQNSIFGPVTPFQNMLIITLPTAAIAANVISCIGLTFRPSLGEIAGYQEMARYEAEAIEEKSSFLAHLQSKADINNNNNNNNSNTVSIVPFLSPDICTYQVNDSQALKNIKEMRDLRYSYGKNKSTFLSYQTEKLAEDLSNHNFSSETISQFLIFIEKEKATEQELQRNNEGKAKIKK